MRKALRLRVIFAELRSAGVEASARDLLRIANIILESFGTNADEIELPVSSNQSRVFFSLPIDEAMQDGGWRVLEFEARRQIEVEDMNPEARTLFIHCIRKVLGPEWQSQYRQD